MVERVGVAYLFIYCTFTVMATLFLIVNILRLGYQCRDWSGSILHPKKHRNTCIVMVCISILYKVIVRRNVVALFHSTVRHYRIQ